MEKLISTVKEYLGTQTPASIIEAKDKEELISSLTILMNGSLSEHHSLLNEGFLREADGAWDFYKSCELALYEIKKVS